jgi:hypothetical protein
MPGKMRWKRTENPEEDFRLELKSDDSSDWCYYVEHPSRVPDRPDGETPGYATFITLLKEGWTTEGVADHVG